MSRPSVHSQPDLWGWGYRWEIARANLFRHWQQHDRAAEAESLANGYLRKLKDSGLLASEEGQADG